jgi:glyoxylase I family protein
MCSWVLQGPDPCRRPPHLHNPEDQKMSVEHVLAVVPVADFHAAHAWYERLFGRPADNVPMEGQLVEWRLTDTGWVQVTFDAARAGSALLNFAVDDLESHIAGISERGLSLGPIEAVNKGVQLSAIRDPDGNTITFIGNFRTNY